MHPIRKGTNNMNEFERLSRIADSVKEQYPEGTRIMLIHMGDDPHPIPDGTRGTVDFVDDIGTVFTNFDNGRRLGLAYGEDSYRKLTDEELAEEEEEFDEDDDMGMTM